MTWPTIVAGGVATVLGAFLFLLGLAVIEAGKGGYGYGPLPFLKVPTDWGLVGVGVVLGAVGGVTASAGLTVLGVMG